MTSLPLRRDVCVCACERAAAARLRFPGSRAARPLPAAAEDPEAAAGRRIPRRQVGSGGKSMRGGRRRAALLTPRQRQRA